MREGLLTRQEAADVLCELDAEQPIEAGVRNLLDYPAA